MKCLIVGNGEINRSEWLIDTIDRYKPDFIIAADGGFNHFEHMAILPDLLLGDFDSISRIPSGENVKILTFPKEKDFTDMELAIEHAIEIGSSHILMVGATGSRLDHSLANMLLLKKLAKEGVEAEIADEHHKIFAINERKTLSGCIGSLVSLLPLDSPVYGVTLKGFKYPLDKACIEMGDTIGISNIAVSDSCEIIVDKGILLGIIADNEL